MLRVLVRGLRGCQCGRSTCTSAPFVASLVVLAVSAGIPSAGGDQPAQGPATLSQEIQKVLDKSGPDVNPEPLEGQLLMLTARWQTPEDRAQIYAAITEIYVNQHNRAERAWKVVGYAKMALEHTADPAERCRLYEHWASAAAPGIFWGYVPKDEFPEARRRTVVPYLHVLAIVAENLKITERQPRPSLPPEIRDAEPAPYHRGFHAWVQNANAWLAEHNKEWELQDTLLLYKEHIPALIVELYAKPPLANDELEALATEIVKKPEIVKEIMDAVEAKIAEKSAKPAKEPEGQTPPTSAKPQPGQAPPEAAPPAALPR